LLERDAKLAAAFDAAGPFRFKNLAAYKGAHGDGDFVVDGDRVSRLEIDGVARFGGAGVDAVAKEQRESRAGGDGNLLAIWSGCGGVGGLRSCLRCCGRGTCGGLLRAKAGRRSRRNEHSEEEETSVKPLEHEKHLEGLTWPCVVESTTISAREDSRMNQPGRNPVLIKSFNTSS
jgi:hypothetical protein